ncbi:HTTM domain-containing protein [Streptomyces sp. Rer75]|uniref:HTTM domain-containing protein n=1 Tax=unclassified Streptomyces TaxID=2593676 RepID=UPI0015CFFC9B|nr:HTTM domain-containing protein [Streptomyces sp. Rer75]QLH21518.1 HTTM domain-containing protein [Streptomyces sp. Rer75]
MNRLAPRLALLDRLTRLITFASRPHASYQAALFRIGLGGIAAAFLLREWPHRRLLYGDRSPWSPEMAAQVVEEEHRFSVLLWSGGHWWFELVYHGAIVASVLLMLGWRTRATSVVFLVAVLSIESRNIYLGDAGDNAMQVMALYLAFTRCGAVWSLDARRRARARRQGKPVDDRAGVAMWQALGVLLLWVSDGFPHTAWAAVLWTFWAAHGLWYAAHRWSRGHQARELLDAVTAMLHNCAMLVIAVQVCLIYATAGWYKIQGALWQEGSGLHYALHLDYFMPWPALGGLIAHSMLAVYLLSYGTVIVQAAFPFLIGYRRLKNVLLAAMMLEHLAIAVVLGIPFLSAMMIVSDAVFLPTSFLLLLGTHCTRWARRMAGAAVNRPSRKHPPSGIGHAARG